MIDLKVPLEEQIAQLIRENKQLVIENRQLKRKIQYEAFLHSEEYQQIDIARVVTYERLKPPKKELEGLPKNFVYLKTVEGHTVFLKQHFPLKVKKGGDA